MSVACVRTSVAACPGLSRPRGLPHGQELRRGCGVFTSDVAKSVASVWGFFPSRCVIERLSCCWAMRFIHLRGTHGVGVIIPAEETGSNLLQLHGAVNPGPSDTAEAPL